MIVLNLELDNLFGFEDFKINFSYPKKVENSSIKDEFLKDRPNFSYKKVNILLGANSTGKTSIGKAMMAIFNFLNKKEIITVTQYIRDIEKTMRFSMDFILDGKNDLYRVDFKYKKENESEKIDLDLYKADILKNDFLEFDGKISYQFQFPNIKTVEFFIPEEEHYKFIPFEKNIRIYDSNVYENYDTSMITEDFRSKSERLFERYCENNPKIKYVYKNGDSGQQYLSIVYTTNMGKQRSFYPDYIVQLNNDKIWLIETKGGESKGQDKNIDEYVENKFSALKHFSEKYGYNFGFVRDKDEELYFNNTKYEKELSKDNWKFIDEIFDGI